MNHYVQKILDWIKNHPKTSILVLMYLIITAMSTYYDTKRQNRIDRATEVNEKFLGLKSNSRVK